jgi:hypothetical protein
MGKIPESYLPPPELRPKRIYKLDEFQKIPQKFNSTEVLLDQTAAKYGDKVAIYFDEQRITYKQLQASVNRGSRFPPRCCSPAPSSPTWRTSRKRRC